MDDIDGLLLSLDADDGPEFSPDAGDNFLVNSIVMKDNEFQISLTFNNIFLKE